MGASDRRRFRDEVVEGEKTQGASSIALGEILNEIGAAAEVPLW